MNDPIGFGTGLIIHHDAQDFDYPVAPLLQAAAAPTSRRWAIATADRDDQGQDPECVGAALAQELAADPVNVAITHPWTRKNIYNLAQKLDEIPGEGYAGTTLNGGMKALRQYGYVTEWRWAANVDEIVLSLSQLGPVIMAGPWLSGMFTPDGEGRLRVSGTSGNIGHCYELGELRWEDGDVVIEQTWGPSWSRLPGPDGGWRAKIAISEIEKLVRMGTQAAIITGRADPSKPTPPPAPPPGPTPPPAPTRRTVTISGVDLQIVGPS